MRCKSCNTELVEGARFCYKCGTAVPFSAQTAEGGEISHIEPFQVAVSQMNSKRGSKTLVVCIVLLCIVIASLCYFVWNQVATREEPVLFPAKNVATTTWGYIDKTGQWRIDAQFDDAYAFHSGYAKVYDASLDMFGFIDTAGNWVVEPKFHEDDCTEFSDSVELVSARDSETGRWGFLDGAGEWAIPPSFDNGEVSTFNGGLCRVKDPDTQTYGYIDEQGTWAIAPQFSGAGTFFDGVARARIAGEELWGYIDTVGNWVIEPCFTSEADSASGLLGVYDSETKLWGFLDSTGNQVLPFSYMADSDKKQYSIFRTKQFSSSDGLMSLRDKEGNWGYMDATGSLVIEPQFVYGEYSRFKEGMAFACDAETKKWGVINTQGAWVIKPTWSIQSSYSLHGKGGYYNEFTNGLALVYESKSKTYSYLNTEGTVVCQWQ